MEKPILTVKRTEGPSQTLDVCSQIPSVFFKDF